jgi:DNA-binding transcriptional LysR family regulator
MNLNQLRYFKAVAEVLHFQRAARQLNLTQPALSYQVKRLEEELGIVLLDRSRKHVELTDAGMIFLKRITFILEALDNAKKEAQYIAGMEQTSLKIGTIDYLNLDIVTKSVIATKVEHPNITIEKIEMPTNEIYDAVKESEIDIAIGPETVKHSALAIKKITSGRWSLVMPSDHVFANEESISLENLKDTPLIIFDKSLNPKLYNWWMENFKVAGFKPKIILETKQVHTALKTVKDGMALYIVASYIVEDLPESMVCKPLTGFDNKISIVAAWRRNNNSKALKIYLDKLRKSLLV